MHLSPVTPNCRQAVRSLLKCIESKNTVINASSKLGSSKFSSKSSENNASSEKNCADSDNFGSLQKPLESQKRASKFISNTSRLPKVKVVKLKTRPVYDKRNNPNVFGNLSPSSPIWYPDIHEKPKYDNDQDDDSSMVRNISKNYRSPEAYFEKMRQLVSEKKLKEALELFVEMKRNFVTPQLSHFTFMIGACGKFGYTEMAFKLLRQMTDRGLKPTCATLTGLFNSCGESPFPEYGLQKANLLKEKIKTKDWQLNQITYHAMIKAFGKCGDIQTAFQIVDEMKEADVKIDVVTYSFLLMSCVANKDAGFTHAIEVWRKMKNRRCQPNLFSFNLLLRAVRDCDVGPEEISCLLLQHWSSYSKRPYGFKVKDALPEKQVLFLQDVTVDSISDADVSPAGQLKDKGQQVENSEMKGHSNSATDLLEKKGDSLVPDILGSQVPSVLNARPVSCAELVELGSIKSASDRLALVGGAEGFLLEMKRSSVKPNVKTFTLLLESLPPMIEAEEQLIALLDVYSIKPDIGFFNMLIKRRNFRFDYAAAHQVLVLINKWSLSPDIITYGVLAVGCSTYRKACIFLNDMRKLGYSPNTETIGALLSNACTGVDFEYMESTLHLMEEQGIEPNERMLKKIERTLELARKNIIDLEHGKDVPNVYRKEGFSKEYTEFCKVYENWLKNIGFDKPEHVWDQYRTDIFEKPTKETLESPFISQIVQ